jgi:hypothetical protein
MSNDGSIQYACVDGTDQYGGIYKSSDYGVTWTSIYNNKQYWSSIATDSTGANVAVCGGGGQGITGLYFLSTNSGTSWTPVTTIPATSYNSTYSCVAMSSNGKYQSVCSTSDNTGTTTGAVFTSIDTGLSWTQANIPNHAWTNISMSSSGRYQYVCAGQSINQSGILIEGVIYYSHDFGIRWIELKQSSGLQWQRVVVSPNENTVSGCYQNGSGSNVYTTIEIAESSIFYKGNVGINNSNPSYSLDVIGNVNINTSLSTSNSLTANGIIQASQFNTTSDYRIKENPIPIDQYINNYKVDHLTPYLYQNKLSNQINIGLIAHEVQEYFPFLVSGKKDGPNYQSVNYIGLIPLLIHEIKLLKERSKRNKEKRNKEKIYKKK